MPRSSPAIPLVVEDAPTETAHTLRQVPTSSTMMLDIRSILDIGGLYARRNLPSQSLDQVTEVPG